MVENKRFWEKMNTFWQGHKKMILVWSIGLSAGYLAVYLIFLLCNRLPAGPDLDNSDWLGFLSGYLTFAGALIMAWLVYKQNERINQLTLQEYRVILEAVVDGAALIEESICTNEDPLTNPSLQYSNGCRYVKHDVHLCGDKNGSSTFYVFCRLLNRGKLKIENLSFDKISICAFGTEKENHTFTPTENSAGNSLNGQHSILPDGSLQICFLLHCFPEEFELSWLRVEYSCKQNKNLYFTFWIKKERGYLSIGDGEHTIEANKTDR